jgi:hypothetical protein
VWHAYDLVFLLPCILQVWGWRAHFYGLKPFRRGILRFSALTLCWQWIATAGAVAIALTVPQLQSHLRVLPYLPYVSVLLLPPMVFTSLLLIGRARFSSRCAFSEATAAVNG